MSAPAIVFSIVLPCYNEADNLPPLLEAYAECWPDTSAELVLVNNGSTDHTSDVLARELARPKYAFARTVLVPVNQGYGFGVNAGLRSAQGEIIGISHADMQCAPADLFAAYRKLVEAGAETALVKGERSPRGFGPSLVTNTMAVLASVVLGMRLSDINAQPKVFHRSLLAHLTDPPNGFELDLYLLYKARKLGLKVLTIPVIFGTRAHGTSKWAFSLLSRWRHIMATVRYIFHLRFSAGG